MKLEQAAVAVAGLAAVLAAASPAQGAVTESSWGKAPSGEAVELFTLTSPTLTVKITNFGAHIVSIDAPDKNGQKADVVLGYGDLSGYLADKSTYMGSIVGRYGNRIAKGTFSLDGQTYHLPTNNGPNTLHGGTVGFDRKVWTAQKLADGVELTVVSPDGDQGFPGKLTAHVRYTLAGNSLRIQYSATTTKPTVVNLTNHSYFNLGGEGSGDILKEVVTLHAAKYTPTDKGLIPTGELAPVAGTPFDFNKPAAIGLRIHDDNQQLKLAGGYDHNFVLDGPMGTLREAVHVVDPTSGRTLDVKTTEPGVQFYSGNSLTGQFKGPKGVAYAKFNGFCLETQHFPDSPNEPKFPTTELKPGQTLHSETVFTFGVAK
jgi:aldose 1-epimerase